MSARGKKVIIIGGGIGGLSAAVYALQSGYRAEVLEMNDIPGGLAMSWRRGDYIFENCLHWLVGSNPYGDLHDLWREVFDIDKLKFINPELFVRIESDFGTHVNIYSNVDRLEQELLRRAPQDAGAIRELAHSVRSLTTFRLIDPSGTTIENWKNLVHDIPTLPLLARLSRMSGEQYAARFTDPLIHSFFSTGDTGKMSATAMILTLAWMTQQNAGYCIGGSQAIIRLILDRIQRLGGIVRCGSRVERILIERDTAIGVQLAGGQILAADWIISAADGHTTLFHLLGERYLQDAMRRVYAEHVLFSSYLQVSLGIALDLRSQPPMLSRLLSSPMLIDPDTSLDAVSFRFFHYDPTFAPPGKTAVTCLLPTRNFAWWKQLRDADPSGYNSEKLRVANAVIALLEERVPGLRPAIEVVDVSTPATVVRYTGNWRGSMEGWLVEPGEGFHSLPNTLPGLRHFLMVGQWVLPGGGLPSGPLTARPALRTICRRDGVAFNSFVERGAEAAVA